MNRSGSYEPSHPIQRCEHVTMLPARRVAPLEDHVTLAQALDWLAWPVASAAFHRKAKRGIEGVRPKRGSTAASERLMTALLLHAEKNLSR